MTASNAARRFVFLFIFFFASPCFLRAAPVTTYSQLLTAIREARHATESRIEAAVDQEKVREAWEIGKLINEHILQQKRAEYDKQVLPRLANDLAISETELYRMLEFARAYPKVAPARELSWSDYRELLALNDEKERSEVEEKASNEKWGRERIREEVQRRKAVKKGNAGAIQEWPKLQSKPGKVGTYKIVRAAVGPETGKLVIDLGFSNYYKTSKDLRFKEGDIIEITSGTKRPGSAPSDLIRLSKRTAEDLYTYSAYVFEVIDGDTIKTVIDLGFGVRSVQTMRFRGLDAPEIISKEGKEAKAFVEKLIAGKSILIRTAKSDKYDRYLADVFVEGKYVNQKLIEEDLAVTMGD